MTMSTRRWIGYDWFKLGVAILLALFLLWLSLNGRDSAVTVLPAVLPTAATEPATAPQLIAPAPGAQVPAGSVTLSGQASPGTEVQISIDGSPAGKARAAGDGTWSLPVTIEQAGQHQVVVQTLDSTGGIAASANPVTLSVAAPQVVAPAMTLPAEPPLAGQVTLAGTGTPESEIEILVDGVSIGKTKVGADGNWSLPANLAAGTHEIVARALAATGQPAAASSPALLDMKAQPIAAPTIGFPTAGAQIDAAPFTMTGTGVPGSEIEILDGEQVLGTAKVGADGTWSFPVTPGLGAAAYNVRPKGGTAANPPISVEIKAAAANAPAEPAANSDLAIGFPADGAQIDVAPFTMTGTGTPGAELEILNSDQVLGTVQVGTDGTWSFPITPSAGTASYGVRPVGAETVVGTPIRVTAGADRVATCANLAVNCDAWVTRVGGLRLRLRSDANLQGQVIEFLPPGTQMTLLEGPRSDDGYSWWRARTLGGREGLGRRRGATNTARLMFVLATA